MQALAASPRVGPGTGRLHRPDPGDQAAHLPRGKHRGRKRAAHDRGPRTYRRGRAQRRRRRVALSRGDAPLRRAVTRSSFDPFAPDYLADPYPILTRLREHTPVFFAPELDMWVITRFADIEEVFKDPERFSARIAQDPIFPLAPEARRILTEGFRPTPTMSNCDPPKHARIRSHNLKAFSPRRIGVLGNTI